MSDNYRSFSLPSRHLSETANVGRVIQIGECQSACWLSGSNIMHESARKTIMNEITIHNGKYRAELCGAQVMVPRPGNPKVTFHWKLADGSSRRIYSVSNLKKKDGTRNERGIELMRKWVPEWDGQDPFWYEQNIDWLRGRKVELVIENGPLYKDPSMTGPQVKYVNPVARPTEGTKTPIILHGIIAPNMIDVIGAYRQATSDMDSVERDRQWLEIVREAVPGKDQDLFTEEDWEKVIHRLRGEVA